MSSRFPANVRFSLESFARHGGLEGPHKDGWGIAYYADEDVRLVKDPHPACDSACVRFIQDHPFHAATVISHIRRATRGAVAMKNCQPFVRELGGRMHVFAHNGHLGVAEMHLELPPGGFLPVGDTDSEYAFCILLERLRPAWLRGRLPTLEERIGIVAAFARAIRPLGPANFLYSDGDALFMHGHKRLQADRGQPRPPGLHVLSRRCPGTANEMAAEGLSVASGAEQKVMLAASVPLTSEPGWRALDEGELVVAQGGTIVAQCGSHGECSTGSGPPTRHLNTCTVPY